MIIKTIFIFSSIILSAGAARAVEIVYSTSTGEVVAMIRQGSNGDYADAGYSRISVPADDEILKNSMKNIRFDFAERALVVKSAPEISATTRKEQIALDLEFLIDLKKTQYAIAQLKAGTTQQWVIDQADKRSEKNAEAIARILNKN